MIPSSVRILVCREPQDFRRSFDGLAAAARSALGEEPRSGALFVFVNKSRNRLKCLWWDENGYCILYKRFHQALTLVPSAPDGAIKLQVDGARLGEMLRGVPRANRESKKKEKPLDSAA